MTLKQRIAELQKGSVSPANDITKLMEAIEVINATQQLLDKAISGLEYYATSDNVAANLLTDIKRAYDGGGV